MAEGACGLRLPSGWVQAGKAVVAGGRSLFRRLFALLILLVLGGAAFYLWKAGPRGFSRPRQALDALSEKWRDTKTAGSVKAALELNRELADLPITTAAEGDGVVILQGRVPNEGAKATAGRLAEAVPGVRRVDNRISVDPGLPSSAPADRTLGENLDDRALEAKIHLAFSLNRGLEGTDIAVRAYRREVVLSGTADSKTQRALAGEIAENVPEVVGVDNEIRLPGEARGAEAAGDRLDPASRVRRALAGNANLSPYRIEVLEGEGRLVLRGRVKTGAEKDLAGYLAREAARRPVENSLRIEP